ncbi:hypothetical protein PG994_012454 [Apiospora phragmitis]|uniref:Uncharacterized protein n=1 Tax=Apiospora phragmitis TaxID=2905665 RepID=A0ABR1TVQ2_9PEZI
MMGYYAPSICSDSMVQEGQAGAQKGKAKEKKLTGNLLLRSIAPMAAAASTVAAPFTRLVDTMDQLKALVRELTADIA